MYTLVDMLQCRGRAALRVKAENATVTGWVVDPSYKSISSQRERERVEESMKIHTLNEKVYVERIQTNDEVNGLPFCGGNSSIFHVGPWEYVPFKVVLYRSWILSSSKTYQKIYAMINDWYIP